MSRVRSGAVTIVRIALTRIMCVERARMLEPFEKEELEHTSNLDTQ